MIRSNNTVIMPSIFEPIGAGIAVALINTFIINNPAIWLNICGGCGSEQTETLHEDDSSTTTSVNDAEINYHHA